MSAVKVRGLTWDHPRGRNALAAAAARQQNGPLELIWDVHPLEGFESTPIEVLAKDYDVIVLDHPHLGDALLHDCLLPLDDLFGEEQVQTWARDAAGPSLASYSLGGKLWALPLDAATQVAATRTDLVDQVPMLWRDVLELASKAPVALSLAGPHALLTFASVCVALGEEPCVGPGFVSEKVGARALALMAAVASRSPSRTADLNPISLLATMTEDDTIAHCPLVFGYVNYADPELPRPVRFSNAPRWTPLGRPGSTIGGTGIALTRRCDPFPELLQHLKWLLSGSVQTNFIPAHSGQPSMGLAWCSEEVNRVHGDFYRATWDTVTEAWVRPRYAGYVPFQGAAAEVVRDVVQGRTAVDTGLREIDILHHASVREAVR